MVKRFSAPGPWMTRDLKPCVLATDFDELEKLANVVAFTNQETTKHEDAMKALRAYLRTCSAAAEGTEHG
jgi:hypothetical protein